MKFKSDLKQSFKKQMYFKTKDIIIVVIIIIEFEKPEKKKVANI
jgi:hypothetical protein